MMGLRFTLKEAFRIYVAWTPEGRVTFHVGWFWIIIFAVVLWWTFG